VDAGQVFITLQFEKSTSGIGKRAHRKERESIHGYSIRLYFKQMA